MKNKFITLIVLIFFSTSAWAQSLYKLPFPTGTTYKCSQGNNGGVSHSGKAQFAFDFAMDIGTSVTAARGGTVHMVVEQWNNGNCPFVPNVGCNNNCIDNVNRIVINHGDGTFGLYLHLTQNGSSVNVGDYVNQGQVIGYSGNSGCSTNSHLHFMVMNSGATYYQQSILTRFCDVSTNNGVPTSGNYYTSQNCITCPSIPITTIPANNSTVGIPVAFDWDDAAGGNDTNYRIQVSSSNNGWSATNGFSSSSAESNIIRVNQTTGNISSFNWTASSNFAPQPNTTYFYTIKTFACGKSSSYSAVKSFTTSCNAAIPTPTLPNNGQSNVTIPVSLDWSDVGNNPQYRVQVSTSASGWNATTGFTSSETESSTVRVNKNTNEISSYNWTSSAAFPPQNGVTYYWTVKAFSCFKNSDYSAIRTFTIGSTTSCSAPVVTLQTPANNQNYYANQQVNCSWTATNTTGCSITEFMFYLENPNGTSAEVSTGVTPNNIINIPASPIFGSYKWGVKAKNNQGIWSNYVYRNFTILQTTTNYTITTSSSPFAGGSTTGNGTFASGTSRTVYATANAEYKFINWTENGIIVSTSSSFTFSLTGNRNLVSNFAPALGTDEFDKKNSSVSPNPFDENIKVENSKLDIFGFQLFDLSGKLILSKDSNSSKKLEINTSEIIKGTYLLKIKTSEGFETYKVIKK